MTRLRVTTKGQLTLRKDLIRHLGLAPGQMLEAQKLPGGRIEVKAVQPAGTIDGFIGLLAGKTRKAATVEEINEAAASGWIGSE